MNYAVTYSCEVHSQERPYIAEKIEYLSPSINSFNVFNLLPGSVCFFTLFAVYNPASIDPGITITTTTLGRAERKSFERKLLHVATF